MGYSDMEWCLLCSSVLLVLCGLVSRDYIYDYLSRPVMHILCICILASMLLFLAAEFYGFMRILELC